MQRIYIELGDEALARIDEIKNTMSMKTKAEVFRCALALLDCTVEKIEEGFQLQLKRDSEVERLVVPFLAGVSRAAKSRASQHALRDEGA